MMLAFMGELLQVPPVLLIAAGAVVLFALGVVVWLTYFASHQARDFEMWFKVPLVCFGLRMGAPAVPTQREPDHPDRSQGGGKPEVP
jgi:hypothetical protein